MIDSERDLRATDVATPAPASAGGWSLADAVAAAERRGAPKAGLARHLAGARLAATKTVSVHEEDEAQTMPAPAPDDAALVARAVQAEEAAWADARIALIGRVLEAEAKRASADPDKAGKVAEHLAPLIGRAFAGAMAEAPGDHARAIVAREREPMETEILRERTVLSVAAKQRADFEARRASIAGELAGLRDDPQRWASVSGRRARLIDDLPLDEPKKAALKQRVAQAQAGAAAEGLLAQEPEWLLEDLDEPDFAAALGKTEAARWRSEAETAIARRAERIAAANAERAQLASVDMRATLKRIKEKADSPLPSLDEATTALGDACAAAAALAMATKGRKQRHAIDAVALMAPADEPAWLDAAPDKETRVLREIAAATKRAAIGRDPGSWLMQHSGTLQELATEAANDPAKLSRLADHYAALRNRVRGHAVGEGERLSTGASNDNAPEPDTNGWGSPGASGGDTLHTGNAPLPDEVAAGLVEQVLAGETPQARLDVLTRILDGAAGGEGSGSTGIGSGPADPDGRARAEAIARQLEALGLPSGTAARWAQLDDPRIRRSTRLALLGGFARQIRDEEAILSGEGEQPEIVGDDSDGDTISLADIETGALSAQYRFDQLRARVQALIDDKKIPDEVGQRFLADERVEALTEAELPPEIANALASENKARIASALSVAADHILAGAAKLAELEEEYGLWFRGVMTAGRAVLFGPASAIIGSGIEFAIERLIEEHGGKAIEFLIGKGADLIQDKIDVPDRGTAEKIAAAALIGGSLLLGIGSIGRFVRFISAHRNFGRAAITRPEVLSSGSEAPMTESVPDMLSYGALRSAQNLDELIESLNLHKLPSNRSFMETVLDNPDLVDLPPLQKRLAIPYFQMRLIPRATEIEFEDIFRPLVTAEGMTLLTKFRLPIGNSRKSTEFDLLTIAGEIDPADIARRSDVVVREVLGSLKGLFDAKSGLGRFSQNQVLMRQWLRSTGRNVDVRAMNLPQGALPEDAMLRAMRELMPRANPRLEPTTVDQIIRAIAKKVDPRLPVWIVLFASMVTAASLRTDDAESA